MAVWSGSKRNWTPTAVGNAANFTDTGHMTLQGGSSTQRIDVKEVYLGGLAGASSPAQMVVARDSTVGATLSQGTDCYNIAAYDPATAALGAPPVLFDTATTKPQRSATLQLLQLGFNAFGDVVRWVSYPGEEMRMLGNTASFGELSLSSGAAGTPGLMTSHFVIETI